MNYHVTYDDIHNKLSVIHIKYNYKIINHAIIDYDVENNKLKEYNNIENLVLWLLSDFDPFIVLDTLKRNHNTLHNIDIRFCNLGLCGKHIAHTLKKTKLKKLYFVDTHFNSADMSYIIKSLKYSRFMQKLSFSDNSLGNSIKPFISLLKRSLHIQKLYIGTCHINKDGLIEVLHSLKNHKMLKLLHFQMYNFTGYALQLLVKILQNNIIKQLDLNWCTFPDNKTNYLKIILKYCRSLNTLSIKQFNMVDNMGSLIKSLTMYNIILHKLDLSNSLISSKHMGLLLQKNLPIYQLDLYHIWIQDILQKEIITGLTTNYMVRYMNPYCDEIEQIKTIISRNLHNYTQKNMSLEWLIKN